MQVLELMNRDIKYLNKNDTILDAMKSMKEHDIGFLLILENKKAIGVITDRDLLLVLARGLSTSTPINKVMKKYVVTIKESDCISDATEVMGLMQIKRLVVVNSDDEVSGIISLSDIARNPLTEEFALEALIEISYNYSTKTVQNDNIIQISAFIK